jgi:cell shape-determining protein MreD
MKTLFKFKNPLKIAALVFFMGALYNAYTTDIIGLVCFLVAAIVFFALSIFRTDKTSNSKQD